MAATRSYPEQKLQASIVSYLRAVLPDCRTFAVPNGGLRGREGGAMPEGPHETANIRAASGGSSRSYVADRWVVRRLTPDECEALQGFPRGYTAGQADGPRYKQLGNSWAVNVARWIGERIDAALRRQREEAA